MKKLISCLLALWLTATPILTAYPGPTMPSAKTEFPIEYRIDWVRLYQTPGEGALHYDAYTE